MMASLQGARNTFRIVSLCPSTTLTLYDLGLANYVVGKTKYCEDHPTRSTRKAVAAGNGKASPIIPRVGGTKDPNWDAIAKLDPTHILFNMEENDFTHLPTAQGICETLADTPLDINGSKDLVSVLGETFDAMNNASEIVKSIDGALAQLQSLKQTQFTYLYFIWHKPHPMVAGKGTYIESMLNAAGGQNLARHISNEQRYPILPPDFAEVADYCFLSTEPFPFKERHIKDYCKFGRKRTCIIDGEKVAWHGSKTIQGLEYLYGFFLHMP